MSERTNQPLSALNTSLTRRKLLTRAIPASLAVTLLGTEASTVSAHSLLHTFTERNLAPFFTAVGPGAASSGNTSVLLAVSGDYRIFYDWWNLGEGGHGFRELPGDWQTSAAPAAALVGENHDYLFVIIKGDDGHLYLNQGSLGGLFVGWQPLSFTSGFGPGTASSGNTTVVVASDLDGRICYNWWKLGEGGRGWVELPGIQTVFPTAVSLVGENHDYLFVTVTGRDGQLYLNQGTLGGPFTGWQPLGFYDHGSGAASSGNTTAVVASTPDGRIFYTWWKLGEGGRGWVELPGIQTGHTPAVSLVGENHDYLFVTVTGRDDQLYLNQGTLGGPFTGWQ